MVKAPRKKATARSNRGSTLVGVFIGLVLGVLLCAGVMWYINGSSLPLQVREAAPPAAAVGERTRRAARQAGRQGSGEAPFRFL
jgi:Tfp pilus assembly protein PilW